MLEGAPAPGAPLLIAIRLQHAQEAIDPDRCAGEVVRAGESGNHAPPEPGRADDESILSDRQHQVGDGQLTLGWRAGAREIDDLVVAQQRAKQDVADPPLRQVGDLGEHGVGVGRFFAAQMVAHEPGECGVAVTEAAE